MDSDFRREIQDICKFQSLLYIPSQYFLWLLMTLSSNNYLASVDSVQLVLLSAGVRKTRGETAAVATALERKGRKNYLSI